MWELHLDTSLKRNSCNFFPGSFSTELYLLGHPPVYLFSFFLITSKCIICIMDAQYFRQEMKLENKSLQKLNVLSDNDKKLQLNWIKDTR